MDEKVKISWYGRCCFLIEVDGKKILFDPYDTFCNVDIGIIDADILISSSTWHDHGHIGASPKAHIYTYPGVYKKDNITITGIEALEDRGSPTVIFNVKVGMFSITNFADFGPEQKVAFDKKTNKEQLDVLIGTNIAFVRPSIKDSDAAVHVHDEIFFDYCKPAILISEHYFPKAFINNSIPEEERGHHGSAEAIAEELIVSTGYPVEETNSYQIEISEIDLRNKKLIKFVDIHPQVKYSKLN